MSVIPFQAKTLMKILGAEAKPAASFLVVFCQSLQPAFSIRGIHRLKSRTHHFPLEERPVVVAVFPQECLLPIGVSQVTHGERNLVQEHRGQIWSSLREQRQQQPTLLFHLLSPIVITFRGKVARLRIQDFVSDLDTESERDRHSLFCQGSHENPPPCAHLETFYQLMSVCPETAR